LRLLIDENLDVAIAQHLQELGHDLAIVARDYPRSLDDGDVLALAYQLDRAVVTYDRDLGTLIFRDKQPHKGVLYLRLADLDLRDALPMVEKAMEFYSGHRGAFCVVTPGNIRLRHA